MYNRFRGQRLFPQASKEYAPCEEKSYGTNHASKNSPHLEYLKITPPLVFTAQTKWWFIKMDLLCIWVVTIKNPGSPVDSVQNKNTKELISSLRDYCINKTKCNFKEIKQEEHKRKIRGNSRSIESVIRSTNLPLANF